MTGDNRNMRRQTTLAGGGARMTRGQLVLLLLLPLLALQQEDPRYEYQYHEGEPGRCLARVSINNPASEYLLI